MATSIRQNPTRSQTQTQEADMLRSVEEQRKLLEEQGYQTKLEFPAPLTEDQKKIQQIFSRGNLRRDAFGRVITTRAIQLELRKIPTIEKAIERETFAQLNKDEIDNSYVSKTIERLADDIIKQDAFITEESSFDLFNTLDSPEGRKLMRKAGEFSRSAFDGLLRSLTGPNNPGRIPPADFSNSNFSNTTISTNPTYQRTSTTRRVIRSAGAQGGGEPGDFIYDYYKDDDKNRIRRLIDRIEPSLSNIDPERFYSSSQLERIFKQAILKDEIDKGNAYFVARLQNRQLEDSKRVRINRRLKTIKGKGERIIMPMNSASFDMNVGYP